MKPMQSLSNANLGSYHTFAIEQYCDHLVEVSTQQQLLDVYQSTEWRALPKLMLGKGSNMLFTERYKGVVVVSRLMGIEVRESESAYHLHVNGGEDWPALVKWCVEQGYDGLENLALIPGCSGSAPIQNIGAYGVEFKDICEYVDILCLESHQIKRLSAKECLFGYRDSIFKHQWYKKAVVIAVGLKLVKNWQPNIGYGPLKGFDKATVTAKQIFERVSQVRLEKLPNPEEVGNAGSFFKNPIVTQSHFESLQERFPEIVAYPAADEQGNPAMKVAAGWLIDQCGLKGAMVGGAQVHPNQALVIVNANNATADDVVLLAAKVRQAVFERYNIELEHEVRFMDATGETNLKAILQRKGLLETQE
ncbi:UDP-N-acetylmuramate dehydrogenase [Vibrio genomosp. F10]|uniref:UDP-N-acetylmuramate dehydrogenase n=1 Tax=Vibrio genomosp. F10 TaxID=723171 RepID=UPI000366248C|nr:UDP-N-acetylmuramate dehydrogenase [Vibrio genomosp. F10]OEF01095.1 UDP-N-acetylenolpyruvoylglucosamine reductase [Vibrio genomosp. F10 str. 9ZD137]